MSVPTTSDTITQGSTSFWDIINPLNWGQQPPSTDAYTIGQFAPNTEVMGPPAPEPYVAPKSTPIVTQPQPVVQQQQPSGFSMNNYPGWDQNSAYQDWLSKGSPTGGQSGGGGSSGPSAQELAINASRSAFNSAYDPIFAQLDEWAGLVPGQTTNKTNDLQGLYTSQQGELGTGMEGSLGALDAPKAQVAASKAQSIRDLQQQMNQMSKAGGMQLGSAGAGDSSAARMYNFALSKAAGQSSADVSNQANSQYAQIQGQEQSIRATFDDQMAKLNTWKATETGNITTWAEGQLGQIRSAKLNATGQKAAALAANEVGIINTALAEIQKIDDQITTWNQGIQTWALNRMATLDDAKTKMSGFGKYTPQSITANELQGLNNIQGADSGGMTGFYSSQKKKETDFLNNYR